MFHIMPESAANLICIKVSGKLTDADYKAFIPKVEEVIEEFGIIRFYVDILDLDGWEWRAAWDDFAFGINHWKDFSKMAIVGDKRWIELSALIASKITKADVRFFDRSCAAEALIWVDN